MQAKSFEVHVFINAPNADACARTCDNPRFAGSVGFFGMGHAGMSRDSSLNFDLELDITSALRRTMNDAEHLTLTFVAVDAHGREVAADDIDLRDVELIVD